MPVKKQRRAEKLDQTFMAPSAGQIRGVAVAWTEYTSLRDCATAEAADGSHFTPTGTAHTLGVHAPKQVIATHQEIKSHG